jgi:hypothetical protein
MQRVFIINGFKDWNKVIDGKHGAFFSHIRKYPNPFHIIDDRSYEDLMNQSQHIQNAFANFTSKQLQTIDCS